MRYGSKFVACVLMLIGQAGVHAATLTQNFDSSWSVEPWNYYGDVAAQRWHYIAYTPWDSTLGTLEEVRIDTTIAGVRDLAAEVVSIRYSFVTGWSPADYQFYDHLYLPGGDANFSVSRSHVWTGSELGNWLTYDYLPSAHYYFESKTIEDGHSIEGRTTLTYTYATNVPEPGTLALLGLGLAGLGLSRRRKAH